jgi:hypothetical protein
LLAVVVCLPDVAAALALLVWLPAAWLQQVQPQVECCAIRS